MKTKEDLELLLSLFVKLFGISVLFGLIGWSFHLPILGMMVIGFVVNFILGTGFTYLYNYKHEKLVVQQTKNMIDYENKYTVKTNCAYCNTKNVVPLDMTATKYKCSKCGSINRLIVDVTSARMTEMKITDDMISRQVEE